MSPATLSISGPAVAAPGGSVKRPGPAVRDTDRDGMPDPRETANGLNPRRKDATVDRDRDGLSNIAEYRARTNPSRGDTEKDRLDPLRDDAAADPDGDEFRDGHDPRDAD